MTTEFRELMEEAPGGPNAGRTANPNLDDESGSHARWLPLGDEARQARAHLWAGGWSLVETSRGSGGVRTFGAGDAGMTAHRGVLHEDEYVDEQALRAAVEAEFGFTADDVRSVYRQGRLTTEQGELRAAIDARLLALSRAGANMLALGRVLGLSVKPSEHGGNCRAIDNALVRAKAAELLTEGRAS